METYQTEDTAVARFSVGSVLGRTFAVLFKNPIFFFGLTLIVLTPVVLLGMYMPKTLRARNVIKVVELILSLLSQGAVTYGVFQACQGNRAPLFKSVARGMARLLPLFGAALLAGLGIGLGTLLFVIPGLILACMWSVAIPACVVERLGPVESLNRSSNLTQGHRMKILGLTILAAIFTQVSAKFAPYIFLLVRPSGTISFVLCMIVVIFIIISAAAYSNTMSAIIYFDLRAVKEGASIDSLVNVFD